MTNIAVFAAVAADPFQHNLYFFFLRVLQHSCLLAYESVFFSLSHLHNSLVFFFVTACDNELMFTNLQLLCCAVCKKRTILFNFHKISKEIAIERNY